MAGKSINIGASFLGGRMRSCTSLIAWIFPRFASSIALRQIPSISLKQSFCRDGDFISDSSWPTERVPRLPFFKLSLFFLCFIRHLLFPNVVVLAESIASKLVSVYNFLFSLVPVFLAFRGDREERYPRAPIITIKAKDFAGEITHFNVKKENLQGEHQITKEHEKNNRDVRQVLAKSNIYPEELPPEEDVKKLERRIKNLDEKVFQDDGKLP